MTEETTTPDTTAEDTTDLEGEVDESTAHDGDDQQESDDPTVDDADADDETPDDSGVKKARKEAAGYRERLRKTETQRDTATELVNSLRKQIIDGQVTELRMKPAALWAAGFSVDDLLNEDGLVDTDRVSNAAKDARAILGIASFGGTVDGGKRGTPPAKTAEWNDLLIQ